MAHKVIVPQKKIMSQSFLNSGTLVILCTRALLSTVKVGNFDHLATFKIILKIFPNSFLTIFYMKMSVYYGTSGIQTLGQGLDRRSSIFFKKCWVVDLTLDRSNFDH